MVNDFLKDEPTKSPISVKVTSTPTEQIQKLLARFTAILLFTFLLIPFLLLAGKIISYTETIDAVKTVMASLGPLTGAVWGFYFQNVKSA
jgi:hypothetical protein